MKTLKDTAKRLHEIGIELRYLADDDFDRREEINRIALDCEIVSRDTYKSIEKTLDDMITELSS
jgi:hypothetical protein